VTSLSSSSSSSIIINIIIITPSSSRSPHGLVELLDAREDGLLEREEDHLGALLRLLIIIIIIIITMIIIVVIIIILWLTPWPYRTPRCPRGWPPRG
jgi:hypothetical protein